MRVVLGELTEEQKSKARTLLVECILFKSRMALVRGSVIHFANGNKINLPYLTNNERTFPRIILKPLTSVPISK